MRLSSRLPMFWRLLRWMLKGKNVGCLFEVSLKCVKRGEKCPFFGRVHCAKAGLKKTFFNARRQKGVLFSFAFVIRPKAARTITKSRKEGRKGRRGHAAERKRERRKRGQAHKSTKTNKTLNQLVSKQYQHP